jgi:transposase-like protein
MTDDRMAVLELVEKGADADLVREMLAFAAERVVEAEAEVAAGAAKGVRTPLREAHRNGICQHSRQTWHPGVQGEVRLRRLEHGERTGRAAEMK